MKEIPIRKSDSRAADQELQAGESDLSSGGLPRHQILLEKFADGMRGHRSSLSPDLDPVSKDRHRRNRGDAKTSGQTRQLFGVDLGHENLTSGFGCDFAYFRRHHFARTAPWRPKVNQHWQSGPADQRIEDKIAVHVHRFTERSQFAFALSAPKNFAEPFVLHPVAPAAFWTGNQNTALIGFNIAHDKNKRALTKRTSAS